MIKFSEELVDLIDIVWLMSLSAKLINVTEGLVKLNWHNLINVNEELVDLIDIVWLMSLLKLIYVTEGLVN